MLADEFNLRIDAVEPNDNMGEEGVRFTQNSQNII